MAFSSLLSLVSEPFYNTNYGDSSPNLPGSPAWEIRGQTTIYGKLGDRPRFTQKTKGSVSIDIQTISIDTDPFDLGTKKAGDKLVTGPVSTKSAKSKSDAS